MKHLLFVGVAAATLASFLVPHAQGFMEPGLARIIFFHLPCAIVATVFIYIGAFASIRLLRTRQMSFDVKAAAANEMGLLMCVLTMVTGILFSKVQWGTWWQWDPRQTSFLMVLLLYSSYFTLRASIPDDVKRAKASAAYAAAMVLPATFLIFVMPRMPSLGTFHPNSTIVSGGFDGPYRTVLYSLVGLILVVSLWMYRSRVRVCTLEFELEKVNGLLETDRSNPAPTGVVRPVSISAENG